MVSLKDNLISRNYTTRLFVCSIILTLSSANFAFDNQGFAQTQAMGPFVERFGDYNPQTKKYALPSTFLSYSNAFPFLLLITGVIIGSQISSAYGRRMTVFVMSIWALITPIIVITAKHRNQFLAGRCLNSIYIGMEMSVIPVFQSEIVPAAVRGLAVGSYQMAFGIGGFVISAVCHRTSTIPNDWSWRIPFLCYFFVPSVIASLIWFQPESPRWYIAKNRIPEARRSLTLFRKSTHDIENELQQIIISVQTERSNKQGSYASTWKGHSRRRTAIVLGSNFFLQATGQAFVSLYGPIVVASIGGISTFNYTLISSGVTFLAYLILLAVNDRIGRRPIMIGGSASQAICMFIVAGVGSSSADRSDTTKAVIVAFIVLYGFSFGVGWAPISYILSAEVPNQQLRDKTSQMGFVLGVFIQFVVAFSLPYMINDPGYMGMKVGFIFGPICVLAVLFASFFVPELKALSLDQVDEMFEQGISARQSRKWGEAKVKEKFLVDDIAGETDVKSSPQGGDSGDVADTLRRV